MDRKSDKEEATALAEYEPVDSEFREHAHRDWRTEGKGFNMYGLRWKYVRLTMEEQEREISCYRKTPQVFEACGVFRFREIHQLPFHILGTREIPISHITSHLQAIFRRASIAKSST